MIKITSEDINDNRKTKSVFKKNGASGSFARRNQSKLVVNVYEFVRVTLLRLVSHYLFAVQRYIGRQMFGQKSK